MKVMTTGEAAKLWNISPRRVVMLASKGRIPGSKFKDNFWLIPADAEKPSDARSVAKSRLNNNRYVFPDASFVVCHEHPVEEFDEEEKLLYDANMQYEAGNFEEAAAIAEALLYSTKRLYIQTGSLYLLSFLYILLRRFDEATSAIMRCFDTCAKAVDHKSEISMFMHVFETFIHSKNWMENDFKVEPGAAYSDFYISYCSYICAMKSCIKAGKNCDALDIDSHELALARLEKDGYEMMSMFCHFYVSVMHICKGNEDPAHYHMKRAIDYAVKNNAYTSLAALTYLLPDSVYSVLREYPNETISRFSGMMNLNASSYADFYAYVGGTTLFSKLECDDYILISYCLKKYTIKRIAYEEKTSVSAVNKQLAALYEKLGVKSKSGLISAYLSAFENPNALNRK